MDEMIRITSADENGFNVINHGDAWINNYLFSYDENDKPNDILFIDFQISYYASPIIDLYYFFVTSTQHNLKATAFDTFIQHYHIELSLNLKKLGYQKKIPSLKDLHIELLKKGLFGSMCTLLIMPIVLVNPSEDAKMDSFIEDTEGSRKFKKALYNNPRYITGLEEILPVFDSKGLLDL